MIIRIEFNEDDIRRLVAEEILRRTGDQIDLKQVRVEVKSKQNYKSEWETAAFRARYEST